jgi:hypothetical protein
MDLPRAASNLVPVPTDVVMLSVTALLAVVALAAAVVAVRAARRTPAVERGEPAPSPPAVAPERLPRTAVLVPIDAGEDAPRLPAPHQLNGRVIVPPSEQQVVGAALSRPQVRLAILLHGLTYALRAESRDRITALMRREYRRRRRERLAAGRRAIRVTQPSSADAWTAQSWIGELPSGSHSSSQVQS